MVSYRKKLNMPAIIKDQRAAVTLYLLPVGAALLILFLAVFNYGRYLTAAGQAELALEASAASVLSYYEPDLTREMGLFALDTGNPRLREKGEAYFTGNLGTAEAVNGQKCIAYTLEFPAEGRLHLQDILALQAVDMQRIEGWMELGKDLLQFFGMTDWENALTPRGAGASPGKVPEMFAGTPGVGGAPGVGAETPAWMREMDGKLHTGGSGRLKFWQFLLPWPAKDVCADRRMPAAITAAYLTERYGLDESSGFLENIFLRPSVMVRDADFLAGTLEQMWNFLDYIKDGLAGALAKTKSKLLFTDYLLQELDFATNKPAVNRYFSRCELEYILWGHAYGWDNLRHTALWIFLLRSCLHVADAVASGEVVDEITLLKAVAQAMVKASADVESLFAGERVSVFSGLKKLSMSYKDHLRLFLLIQNSEEQKKALRRVVQVNLWHWAGGDSGIAGSSGSSGGAFGRGNGGAYGMGVESFALSRYATEIRVTAETELSLWPFGTVRIRREGVMGYDRPFTLLSP